MTSISLENFVAKIVILYAMKNIVKITWIKGFFASRFLHVYPEKKSSNLLSRLFYMYVCVKRPLTFPCIPSMAFSDSSAMAYRKNAKPLGLLAILSITKFTTIMIHVLVQNLETQNSTICVG